jgi:hypothetical protein
VPPARPQVNIDSGRRTFYSHAGGLEDPP